MRGYLAQHPLPPDLRVDPQPQVKAIGTLLPDDHPHSQPFDHTREFVMGNEFYIKFTGMQLRDFPDVPLKVGGLINTSTHKLAIETDPLWTLVIRHVGSWRVKTRPRVRLYPDGKAFGRAPSVCFTLPACYRFNNPSQAFEWMKCAEFTLSPHNINLRAVQTRALEKERQILKAQILQEVWDSITEDEVFAMLDHFTNERLATLPRPKRPAEPDTTNVVDFSTMRERIERIIAAREEEINAEDIAAAMRASA